MTDQGLKGIILHTSGDRHRRIAMQDDFFLSVSIRIMSLSLYHLEGACLAVGKRLHHYVYALLRSLEPCAVKAELPSSFP